jgi:hypothetical protein
MNIANFEKQCSDSLTAGDETDLSILDGLDAVRTKTCYAVPDE